MNAHPCRRPDPRIPSGTWTRSSISSTSSRSPTATPTASATFAGLTSKLDHLASLGVDCLWLQPMYPSPFRDDGYDISDYTSIHPSYGTLEDFTRLPATGAQPRPARRHRAGPESHLGSARLVSGSAELDRQSAPRLVRVERYRRQVSRRPHHLHRHRALELGVGPGVEGVLLAPLLQPSAGSQLRQPRGARRDLERDEVLAGSRRGRLSRGRRALSGRARGHVLREPARDARRAERTARAARRQLHGQGAARRGQHVAGRRAAVFRRRRRVPHVVSFSDHAEDVHGAAARGSQAAHRHHRAHAQHSGVVSVGAVPPQPRRADAGDGHRPRTPVHVGRVRQGPARAHQPRHPPPARAADGRRPPPHRADERAADVAARQSHPVLRRRDRHGRQRLSRRSQHRAHADAVERQRQRRLLHRPTPSACGCR